MIEFTLFIIIVLLSFAALVYYDQLPNSWNRKIDRWAQLWLNRHDYVVMSRGTYQNTLTQLKRSKARLRKLGGGSRSKTSEPTKQARRLVERQADDMEDAADGQL